MGCLTRRCLFREDTQEGTAHAAWRIGPPNARHMPHGHMPHGHMSHGTWTWAWPWHGFMPGEGFDAMRSSCQTSTRQAGHGHTRDCVDWLRMLLQLRDEHSSVHVITT
eukprot:2054938-Prymnesium_polylepis.1